MQNQQKANQRGKGGGLNLGEGEDESAGKAARNQNIQTARHCKPKWQQRKAKVKETDDT